MKILITGGAGYIGSHVLLSCLQVGHQVTVLDDFSNSSPEALRRVEKIANQKITVHRGDVRDENLLNHILFGGQFDIVVHLAGKKSVSESTELPLDYYDVNVGGSIVLSRVMEKAGVFRLVFSSTASVYGDQAEMPLTEKSSLGQAASPYGRSKRMVEQVFEDLCSSDPRWGVAVLRYFNPVGAHPSGLIGEDPRDVPANLVPYAMQVAVGRRQTLSVFGDNYPTHDGTGVRDYIHVLDLAEGHLAAMNYMVMKFGYRVWNLGTGQGHSVMDVIKGIEQVTGYPLSWTIAPQRPGDVSRCWADPSLAATDLGWRAKRGLQDMLSDHWRWQKQNPEGYCQ